MILRKIKKIIMLLTATLLYLPLTAFTMEESRIILEKPKEVIIRNLEEDHKILKKNFYRNQKYFRTTGSIVAICTFLGGLSGIFEDEILAFSTSLTAQVMIILYLILANKGDTKIKNSFSKMDENFRQLTIQKARKAELRESFETFHDDDDADNDSNNSENFDDIDKLEEEEIKNLSIARGGSSGESFDSISPHLEYQSHR